MKKGEMKNVNLTEFYKRKEELDNYLNINNLNANKININISSKISENSNKAQKMLKNKINRLKIYKKRILEIVNESDKIGFKKN